MLTGCTRDIERQRIRRWGWSGSLGGGVGGGLARYLNFDAFRVPPIHDVDIIRTGGFQKRPVTEWRKDEWLARAFEDCSQGAAIHAGVE